MNRRDKPRLWNSLYAQVLVGIVCGVLLGILAPARAAAMRPLGDGFIKLIRMLIGPIIFTTVVVGIAQTGTLRHVGRIGLRALLYFEVVSTFAIAIGLIVVTALQPGAGLSIDPATLDTGAVASYAAAAKTLSATEFVLNVIPTTIVDAFARGEVLQILLISVLCGLALLQLGERARALVDLVDTASRALFQVVAMIMCLAPVGAFGAMAFTVGRYGIASLLALAKLMAGVYLTCGLFVFVVLGAVAWRSGVSLWKLLKYIREEIVIVLGTSSSESVLPRIMRKLERLGCSRTVVGLVVPTGYSFNLDGTAIYMTMGAIFVAQATHARLTMSEQLGIIAILLLTSKGAAAVTGGGFVTLAATLAVVPKIPVAGLALLIGVDRFMSEARAVTNLIGNAVATVAVARWDGALDMACASRILNGQSADESSDDRVSPADAAVDEALTAAG